MPETDAERAAIRDQMEKILSSSLFRQSKRYPALFRYIVENTLSGRTDRLKERTLGVEVFLRDPDYDTNLDPVVRTSAGEIRKRLAQYYLQAGDEIRIDLPSGCYVAEFHPPDAVQMPAAAAFPLRTARPAWLPYGLAAIVFSALLVLTFARMKAPSPLDRFWAPVFDSPDPVLLCLGGPKGATPITRLQERSDPADGASPITVLDMMKMDRVAFSDALTLSRLAGLLQSKNKYARIQRGISTSFEDLRHGPAVLIGGFNNDWTLRLTSQMRFTLERNLQTGLNWIQDRQNPSDRRWLVDISKSYLKMSEDFALISRIWDATTERVVSSPLGSRITAPLPRANFSRHPLTSKRSARPRRRGGNRKICNS